MQIRVLGNLEASADDRSVALGGPKQRAVLAMLGLEANRTVSADRLIEGLWGEQPPQSAPKMLQNYVWRLRQALNGDGDAQILTRGRGYELRIDPELVDVRRFERLVAEADQAAAANVPTDAAHEALALFRGEPLADLVDEPFAPEQIRRLEELRDTATELAIDTDLAAGRHRDVADRIEAVLAKNPLREQLHAQRMLALYRCGRQADALDAYQHARRTLVEEIGVEPGVELRQLQDAILNQDPALLLVRVELPRELDAGTAPAIIGRDGELAWLRERWGRAIRGEGALIGLLGADGMGKTRLAGELAGEAHRSGATVLYVTGWQRPEAVADAARQAREATEPTLLVVDDADTGEVVVGAVGRLGRELSRAPALAVAISRDADTLSGLGCRESLELEPLDADAVRRIARAYAPDESGADVPVDELLRASGGVPSLVHEVVGGWAQRRAERRVAAVARRAAADRSELRSAEAELAGGVAALQVARDYAESLADDRSRVVCPFKGLASFDAADAEVLLRPRAARRRACCAAGRHASAGRSGSVG